MQSHKLLSFLKCPVCLETMKPPILQCSTGHAMCSKCQKRINECPLCKSQISNTRAFALEALSEELISCVKCNHKVPLHCLQIHEENFCGKEGLQRRELALGNWRNINNMHQANRENYGTDNNRNNFENRKDESSRDWNNSENNKNDTEFDILLSATNQVCDLLEEKMDSSRPSSTKSENLPYNRTDVVEYFNSNIFIDDTLPSNNSWTTINGSDKSLSDTSSSSCDFSHQHSQAINLQEDYADSP